MSPQVVGVGVHLHPLKLPRQRATLELPSKPPSQPLLWGRHSSCQSCQVLVRERGGGGRKAVPTSQDFCSPQVDSTGLQVQPSHFFVQRAVFDRPSYFPSQPPASQFCCWPHWRGRQSCQQESTGRTRVELGVYTHVSHRRLALARRVVVLASGNAVVVEGTTTVALVTQLWVSAGLLCGLARTLESCSSALNRDAPISSRGWRYSLKENAPTLSAPDVILDDLP